MTTPRYLSGSNGFIPEATGQAIAYVRDPSRFKFNEYVQIVNSPKPIGVYAFLDPDQPVRVPTDAEFRWADGDHRPESNYNQANFKWLDFVCQRYDYGYTLGEQALDTADWPVHPFFNAMTLSQAMTNRTANINTTADSGSNWSGNTATANTLNNGAGLWSQASADPSSGNYLAIKKSLLEAVRRVVEGTNGMVQIQDMCLVVSPGLALAMAETDEINAFLKNNVYGLAQVQGGKPGQNNIWGLPEQYQGVKIVVEDAVIVNSRPVDAGTLASLDTNPGRSFIKSDTSAWLVSRPGGLEGNYGAPSFSTLQLYYYKYNVAVEAFSEPKHKLIEGHVVDQFAIVLAAPQAGYQITACK